MFLARAHTVCIKVLLIIIYFPARARVRVCMSEREREREREGGGGGHRLLAYIYHYKCCLLIVNKVTDTCPWLEQS